MSQAGGGSGRDGENGVFSRIYPFNGKCNDKIIITTVIIIGVKKTTTAILLLIKESVWS